MRARFEGVPATYGHVIVDEAQDLTLLQLRAVQRRSTGLSLVGDDAQRSRPHALGLRRAADQLEVDAVEMTTAYRMSAEIADWLNAHAPATGHRRRASWSASAPPAAPSARCARRRAGAVRRRAGASRWPNVATITSEDTWGHKGVEYDAVVVDAAGMDPPSSTSRPPAPPTSSSSSAEHRVSGPASGRSRVTLALGGAAGAMLALGQCGPIDSGRGGL